MFALLVTFLFSSAAWGDEVSPWQWDGVELIGAYHLKREQLLAQVPLVRGARFQPDPAMWNAWCARVQSAFADQLTVLECSALQLPEYKAYLVVDIREKDSVGEAGASAAAFRAATELQSRQAVSPEVQKLYQLWVDRKSQLFQQGLSSSEYLTGSNSQRFLGATDTELQRIALQLHRIIPQHQNDLLAILHHSASRQERAAAATLLSWTRNPDELLVQVAQWLDDPAPEVRNNLSRFLYLFLDESSTAVAIVQKLIPPLARQLTYPSHGDRNKALFALRKIARQWPALRASIALEAGTSIDYLAQTSILPNVGGIASEISAMLRPHLGD